MGQLLSKDEDTDEHARCQTPLESTHRTDEPKSSPFFPTFRAYLYARPTNTRPVPQPAYHCFLPEYIMFCHNRPIQREDVRRDDVMLAFHLFQTYLSMFDKYEHVRFVLDALLPRL